MFRYIRKISDHNGSLLTSQLAMTKLPEFPTEIRRYVTSIFAGANRRVCEKIGRVPNTPEESLDLTLIEYLSQYSAPRIVAPGLL